MCKELVELYLSVCAVSTRKFMWEPIKVQGFVTVCLVVPLTQWGIPASEIDVIALGSHGLQIWPGGHV